MSVRPVLHFPRKELTLVAEPLNKELFGTQRLKTLLADMVETMRKFRGIGLAATQIDVHKQVIVIELQDGPLTLINPTIKNPSKQQEVDEEGCLSVPGVFGHVSRAANLKLEAYDENGKRFTLKAAGLFARVIQHEVDHINGHLFLDRCHRLTSGLETAKRLGITIPPLGKL